MNAFATRLTLTWILAALWGNAAEVESIRIPSTVMKREIPTLVVRPDTRSAQPTQRFPTLYLLHGAGDNERGWIDHTPVCEMADTYGIIIVTPSAGTSWYFNSPVDATSQFETFVAAELVGYMDQHYPTIAKRTARALAGNSMGGHGSMFLAIRHRDTFSVAAPMSGGMDIRASDPQIGAFPEMWDIKQRLNPIQENPARWDELTVINVVDTLKKGELAISIDCGDKDFFLTTNRELHAKLIAMDIAHEYSEHAGAHNWDYWKLALPRQMAFVASHLEKK